MKSTKYLALAFAAVFSLSLMSSCSNDNSSSRNKMTDQDSKENAEDHNDAKFSQNAEKDAQFLVEAADISLKEIEVAKLASTKGNMKEVRDLGAAIQHDHQMAYDEITGLARKKNISVPTVMSDSYKRDYNDLSDKRGNEFDKDLCDAMVSEHKTAIDKFEKASKESTDPDIQAWASNQLPSLRMHLDDLMNAQEKSKNTSMNEKK